MDIGCVSIFVFIIIKFTIFTNYFYLQDILLPGFFDSDTKIKMETPIFGLAGIKDDELFQETLETLEKHVIKKFWCQLSKLHHFGNFDSLDLQNSDTGFSGFSLLTYLISKHRVNHSIILLEKYPQFLTMASNNGWTPLHEAVRVKCAKLIHILMRKGADPDKIGSMDVIENNGISMFGTRAISPKMMSRTWFKSMETIMNYEITFRNKHGIDNYHSCSMSCEKIIAENDKSDNTSDEEENKNIDN